MKARKSLSAMTPKPVHEQDSVDHADKAVKSIKRNRKQRHTKLKEMIANDDDDRPEPLVQGNQVICPVCSTAVHGDEDFINAHVNSCVSNAARMQSEAEERDLRRQREEEDVDPWEDDGTRLGLRNVGGLRRLGIDVRDQTQEDIEEDIDIDGDDEVAFGDAQFTEGDLLGLEVTGGPRVEEEDGENDGKTLRDLVSEGKIITRRALSVDVTGIKAEVEEVMGVGEADRMDDAITAARRSGQANQLVTALENKIRMLVSQFTHIKSYI